MAGTSSIQVLESEVDVGQAHLAQRICRPLHRLMLSARRHGLWWVQGELEESLFRLLQPERHRALCALVGSRRQNRDVIRGLVAVLQSALEAEQIDATVAGRPKRMFSIQRKLERTGVALGEIYDVRALRIIVADVPACYAALNVVHQIYRPIPGELDDYIASPKGNGYRSLHTAALDERGRPFEIQIRTRAMHRTAEMGSAAHWRYKELTAPYPAVAAAPAPLELRFPTPVPLEATVEEVEEPVR